MSELGPGAAFYGTSSGTVTLYGSPNTILSGNLAVYAKDYTIRTYNLPTGPVTFSERTGGFRSGSTVFYLTIDEQVSNARKGVMASVPQLLVYLRERDLTADPAPLQ
jgi:hypothetical protein